MASHVIDSVLFQDQFGTQRMRDIFSDENMVQKWLDVEAALAKVEGELGIIPMEAGQEICVKAKVELMDFQKMKKQIDLTGHPIVPLIRVFQDVCNGDAGEYIHWGATTQDIMDTATILQIKEAYQEIFPKAVTLLEQIKEFAARHRDLVMTGRTHGQHALPITLGFKAAVWASEMKRNIERMKECEKRIFVGQFSGAVGTLASLGEIGIRVQEGMMKELGLGVPEITWHTARDNLAEFVCVLGILTSTVGKIANEIVNLQKTEFSEVEEPFVMGKVGSSTMPQKRNPMISENVISLSKIIRSAVPLAIEAMIGEHERDMRGWQTEWEFIPRTCLMCDALLKSAIYIIKDLIVYPENIESNMFKLKGLMLSEAVMLKLAATIGRQEAHEIVYQTCMAAFEKGVPLKDALLSDQKIAKEFDVEILDNILDPHNYTGLAGEFVDRVVGEKSFS